MNVTTPCQTSYTPKNALSDGQKLVLIAFDLFSLSMNIFTNSLVIASLKITSQLHNLSLRLILLLSISDICSALVLQTLFAIMLVNYSDKDYCRFDSFVNFFGVFFTHISLYIVVVIGLDHFGRMKYLNRYPLIVTKRRVYMTLMAFMSLSFLQASMYVIGTIFSIFSTTKSIAIFIDVTIGGTAFGLYIVTIFIVKKHRQSAQNRQLLANVDKMFTRLASCILLALVIFYTPYALISVTHSLLSEKLSWSEKQALDFLFILSYVLIYSFSSANATIFLFINKKAKNLFPKHFSANMLSKK